MIQEECSMQMSRYKKAQRLKKLLRSERHDTSEFASCLEGLDLRQKKGVFKVWVQEGAHMEYLANELLKLTGVEEIPGRSFYYHKKMQELASENTSDVGSVITRILKLW